MQSLGASQNGTPSHANGISNAEPNLRSYYQNKRSPAKGSHIPATPSQNRPLLNLLDFELPPPPTPRSLPTVTIREMESAKSQFQSQISSLTASLSGKEAEVESLSRAIADAERRVGEAQETVREERSTREYAEAQMEDWKKKGEEVQTILQDVQSELARNDEERDQLLARLADAERRAEDAESRSTELETRLIEAESKNVDMTTFINNDEDENKKIYSEIECQSAIAEKVNEVARDLHAAYKAKHEKKIKALKENYQKKADERCKELRVQITKLERQIGDAEDRRDDTFSKFEELGTKSNGPCETCVRNAAAGPASNPEDVHNLEAQRFEIESLKAKLAGLQSELHSLRKSQQTLLEDLEAERVEKGELVAAAEQMLVLCGEKMESMQQEEDFRRSQAAPAQPPLEPRPTSKPRQQPAPEQAMRNTGFLAGGSSVSSSASRPGSSLSSSRSEAKPKASGMPRPGGFGFKAAGESALSRSQSGAGKSRLLSNIERMGSTKGQE
jgi:chromosome segregation ATPase